MNHLVRPAVLSLLAPEAIPPAGAFARWRDAEVFAAVAPAVAPRRVQGVSPNGGDDHDAYFRVQRVEGDAAAIYLNGIATAAALLRGEVARSCSPGGPALASRIDRALVAQWCAACAIERPPAVERGWRAGAAPTQAMRRWIRGHQIFAVLTQGLIVSLRQLDAALATPRADLGRAVDALVLGLDGSAAALEFTADFAAADYTRTIRPSMLPPHVPPSFSGLMSADHRVFATALREHGPALAGLRAADAAAHQRLHAALASVYDSHRFVCERFVGSAASLRGGDEAPAGAAQIDKFKALRLRAFEPAAGDGALPSFPLST